MGPGSLCVWLKQRFVHGPGIIVIHPCAGKVKTQHGMYTFRVDTDFPMFPLPLHQRPLTICPAALSADSPPVAVVVPSCPLAPEALPPQPASRPAANAAATTNEIHFLILILPFSTFPFIHYPAPACQWVRRTPSACALPTRLPVYPHTWTPGPPTSHH